MEKDVNTTISRQMTSKTVKTIMEEFYNLKEEAAKKKKDKTVLVPPVNLRATFKTEKSRKRDIDINLDASRSAKKNLRSSKATHNDATFSAYDKVLQEEGEDIPFETS